MRLERENVPELFCKMKKDKICKIKLFLSFELMNNTKHSSNKVLKSAKQFHEKLYIKRPPQKLTFLTFLAKFL